VRTHRKTRPDSCVATSPRTPRAPGALSVPSPGSASEVCGCVSAGVSAAEDLRLRGARLERRRRRARAEARDGAPLAEGAPRRRGERCLLGAQLRPLAAIFRDRPEDLQLEERGQIDRPVGFERPGVRRAGGGVEGGASAVAAPVAPFAFVRVAAAVADAPRASPVPLTALEVALVPLAGRRDGLHAFAVPLVERPLAVVAAPVLCDERASSNPNVPLEPARERRAVGERERPWPVHLAHIERADVLPPVAPQPLAAAGDLVVREVALVVPAVRHREPSPAVRLAMHEIALVPVKLVREPVRAATVSLARRVPGTGERLVQLRAPQRRAEPGGHVERCHGAL
jgi:hypothetical protein